MKRWGRKPGEYMWLAEDLRPNCEGGVAETEAETVAETEGEAAGEVGTRAVLTREEGLGGSVV